ncbi:MAG: type I secretion system permease/ATPase, partial [Rickettsiales bacterium]|nr:type I secretion system permease/ATPase [Rickettsiales bacterium]
QTVRSFVLIRVAEWLEVKLSSSVLKNIVNTSATLSNPSGSQALRDLTNIKGFLTGSGINAFFDLPWSFIYLFVIWAIHPVNGIIAFVGAILLFIFALINEYATRDPLEAANEQSVQNMRLVEIASRNAEVIEAMGMTDQLINNWANNNKKILDKQSIASYRAAVIANISKVIRMFLQVIIVAAGTYFALQQQLSIGAIIACSILVGRVLAPFDAAIASWKGAINARQAYERLSKSLDAVAQRPESIPLPEPEGRISVENVIYMPPNQKKPVLKGVNFSLDKGEILGIVGPSAAGKSTLAKLIVGVWKPQNGIVRLDGADVYQWQRKQFGEFVGYLPQDVELFSGTLRSNIARLDDDAKPEDVVRAAQLAGAHELILRLPNGYETDIGTYGSSLSAGQRQRIGLARALYGNPKLVVLDEPNANLDQEGELALQQTLARLKQAHITTIAIAHRPSLLANVDKILVLKEGAIAAFGPRDEVLKTITQQGTNNASQKVAGN